MRTVNISDLEANLNSHIQFVRSGEEVLVCDQNEPVARIVPCLDFAEQQQRLIARGVLTPPRTESVPLSEWPELLGDVPAEAMDQMWREERGGR
jgi:antitoxin (DNA-binding transcriptional repressor) of toxin-antitoxin stability system